MAHSPPPSSVFDIHIHTIQASHIREYARATATSQEAPLLLHVKQYTPKHGGPARKGDITIIGAHANAFPKELYEPLYEDLLAELHKQGLRLRAIWIADAAHQGQSGILNAANLGNDPSWLDYARDIAHLINTVRPPRPLIAMGHSFGANALANVALMHPRLFAGFVMLDPVIARFAAREQPQQASSFEIMVSPASLSVIRRDTWPSRAAAREAFLSKQFYRDWDPRVLDLFVQHGLRDDDDDAAAAAAAPSVRLTTTKHQEVFTFVRPLYPAVNAAADTITNPSLIPDYDFETQSPPLYRPVYRPEQSNTFARLPNLRPPVLYIFGGKSTACPPPLVKEKLDTTGVGIGGSGGMKAGRVKHAIHPDCGHLVPLEKPLFCAKAAAIWAKTEIERWWEEEKAYEEWTSKSLEEKSTMDDELKRRVAPLSNKNSKAKASL
ncbi:Alpha/beta hydrolase family domain-containing protein [Trichoderma austrokoningii]